MNTRLAVGGVLGATAVAGLLFTPVFGLAGLVVPVLVVAVAGYGCVELCLWRPRLTPWRPLLMLFAGLLGLIEPTLFSTTVAGLPTVASLRGLEQGLTQSWLLTLESTLPARPDADQLLFVPLAVLTAMVLGLELLLHLRKPMAALLPSLAVAGLSQAYQALTGVQALFAALAYLAPVGLLLWSDRFVRGRRPSGAGVLLAVPMVIAIVAGVVAIGSLDPVGREPYRLADGHLAAPPRNRLSNPLDEIASRLSDPGQEVFSYSSDVPVDRWRMIVLSDFDGVSWSADARLRRMGTRLDGVAGATVGTADLRVRGLSGPWLPSQPNPISVTEAAPLVDQAAGTLLLDRSAPTDYRLTWSATDADPASLATAPVDPQAAGGLGGLGVVPDDLSQIAWTAVRGLRPTFQSALQLQRFLTDNYQLAVGDDLPTGSGWPQLRQFLTVTKRGTSEQFAAAYVALARITGLPARLVVGYRGSARAGAKVVHNSDVLAWPEVAVAGVGWVPLDPTARAQESDQSRGLAGAAARAQAQLPPPDQLRPPQLPSGQQDSATDAASGPGARPGWVVAAVTVVPFACWLFGVPLAKATRARRRRRRRGADGVLGAWAEARDRLYAHRVPCRAGMTPRDLAESAGSVFGERVRTPMIRLAYVLDFALWARFPATDAAVGSAWAEVHEVRRALSARPLSPRLRAALDPRPLFPRRQG